MIAKESLAKVGQMVFKTMALGLTMLSSVCPFSEGQHV